MNFPSPIFDEAEPTIEKRGWLSISSFLKRCLREPLFQFLLIGGVLFAGYALLNPGSNQVESSKRIDLTMDDLKQLEVSFAAKWQRSPTEEEFAQLVESKIREEVLYREALALGLGKEDTIVKRRMVQKMEFARNKIRNAATESDEARVLAHSLVVVIFHMLPRLAWKTAIQAQM